MPITPEEFSAAERGYVEAPAGYGKTELIADSLNCLEGTRQLLLTHTHAGVRAIRERLAAKRIPPDQHRVDTIAGFALRWSVGYPEVSGFDEPYPSGGQWREIYPAARRVLEVGSLIDVVATTYDGLIVDEYQDCSRSQHHLVTLLADALPARVVGDPLQGILGFDDEDPLVTKEEVIETFEELEGLDIPYRWRDTSPDLGEWLGDARTRLLVGAEIDWESGPIDIRDGEIPTIVGKLNEMMGAQGTVVALRAQAPQAHDLAKRTGAKYTSMETIACEDLLKHASNIEQAGGPLRSAVVIDFTRDCVANTGTFIDNLRSTYDSGDLVRPTRGKRGRVMTALNMVAESDSLELVWPAVEEITELADRRPYRAELYWEMKRSLERSVDLGVPLGEAAWQVRDRTRRLGRRLYGRLVSRTALVKGLEFDHVAVLDVADLDVHNTYVAITRGSTSLAVFT